MNNAQMALRNLQIKARLEILNNQLPELEEFQNSLNDGDSTTFTRCGKLDDVQVEICELEKEFDAICNDFNQDFARSLSEEAYKRIYG